VAIVGFEPRCFAAAEFLLKHGVSTDISFCVHYSQEDMREVNETHITTLNTALTSLSRGRDPMPIEHHEQNLQQDFGESLVAAIKEAGFDLDSADTHVAFDISVGSSRLVMEGLHALLQTSVTVTVVYSEASEYRPYFNEYCEYHKNSPATRLGAPEFLSIGVETVDVLRCMPGHSGDARPLYLAAFPCFAPTRIGAVFEEMGPSRVQWLFGVPHLVKNRWRMDAQRDYHSAMVEPNHRHCYISTFDYRETIEVLENIYRRRRGDYSVLVCCLGSTATEARASSLSHPPTRSWSSGLSSQEVGFGQI